MNTPTPLAQKYWITNGALHAHHVVVFAHLISHGVNHGMFFEGNDFVCMFDIAIV